MAYRGLLTNPSVRPPTPAIDKIGVSELYDLLGAIISDKETLWINGPYSSFTDPFIINGYNGIKICDDVVKLLLYSKK